MRREAGLVAGRLAVECLADEPLAAHLSMRVGGPAAALLRPRGVEQTRALVGALARAGVPVRLLGGGSNVIAGDGRHDSVVVQPVAGAEDVVWDGARARVPGGLALGVLLREAMRRGLTGLEWAAGLPGSVGGAVVGNAGAFGGEMSRHVRAVELLGASGEVRRHAVGAGDFAYRSSFVGPDELVLDVDLELETGDTEAVRRETERVNRRRAATQPKGGHSSGCIFKNPEGDHAGRLIDACGLKGRRRGGARVSETHGNFIVNDGTATATDILELIEEVRAEVARRTGVSLELEIKIWQATPVAGEGSS